MGATVELFGIQELDEFFSKMKRSDQRRIIMDAFRIGSSPLIATARELLKSKLQRRRKDNLLKSLGFVPGRSKGNSVFVSAKVGARRFGNYRGYHGHLFDAGTAPRETKQGFNRGAMPASNFFTQSVKQTESQVTADIEGKMLQALEKYIGRNLKKQQKTAV